MEQQIVHLDIRLELSGYAASRCLVKCHHVSFMSEACSHQASWPCTPLPTQIYFPLSLPLWALEALHTPGYGYPALLNHSGRCPLNLKSFITLFPALSLQGLQSPTSFPDAIFTLLRLRGPSKWVFGRFFGGLSKNSVYTGCVIEFHHMFVERNPWPLPLVHFTL